MTNTKANEAPERLTALRDAIEFIRNDEAYTVALREVKTVERTLARVDPPTSKVETVESALAELRQLQDGRAFVSSSAAYADYGDGFKEHFEHVIIIPGRRFQGDTLSEAMAQVRAWRKESQ